MAPLDMRPIEVDLRECGEYGVLQSAVCTDLFQSNIERTTFLQAEQPEVVLVVQLIERVKDEATARLEPLVLLELAV